MKIGEFSDSFLPIIDGVGRVVKAYADTLSARKQEVYVICPLDKMGHRGKYNFEVVDYVAHSFSKGSPWKIGIDQLDPHFTARMKMIDLDICHSHSPVFAGQSALHYARVRNIPRVATFHSQYYDDILLATKSTMLARIGTDYIVNYYNLCDEVWAVSEATGETLKSYGYKGKIIAMPNGTDRHVLHEERLEETVSKFNLKRDVPILLFVGQINWKKNLKRIIEGCSLLKKEGVDFQLVFAGKGPDEDAVKSTVRQMDLEDRTVMTGHLQDTQVLDCLYHLSTLFVFPSIYDNAPMVLREAAAMRTSAVAVKGSCTAEVIEDGVNGTLCEDTSEDFCKKVKQFLALPEETRHAIEEQAFETIPIKWDGPIIDMVMDRYQNLINLYKFKNRKFE